MVETAPARLAGATYFSHPERRSGEFQFDYAMKHVFTATTMSADQEIVKGLLDEAKIPCMIRNEHLSMALGELAPANCSPEIWIQNDEDYPRAREIVDGLRKAEIENHGPWVCRCGETIEGQFTSCWNCGRERPTA